MGWLVKRLLPKSGIAFFFGSSGLAKTFLALEIGLRVSRGEPVDGRTAQEAGVIYIAAEDANGVRQRVKAWVSRCSDHGAFQLIPEPPNLRDEAVMAELLATIGAAAEEMDADGTPLGLLVLDTLSKAAPGADQNASADMGEVMARLEAISVKFNCLVLVVAHPPKD